jgi:hypothetical protein
MVDNFFKYSGFKGSAFLASGRFSPATCFWRLAIGKTDVFDMLKQQIFRGL